jgi:hypothetical protein
MTLRITAFLAAVLAVACAGGNAAQRPDCPAGQTSLDGTCVSQPIADYVGCVRATGATVAADSAKSLSAAAGMAGVTGSTQAEVKDKLERSYAKASDANSLEIIRDCYAKTSTAAGSNASNAPGARDVDGAPLPGAVAAACSKESTAQSPLTIVNNSSAPVGVWWVDFKCNEKLYDVVPANGGRKTESTYATHPWRLRSDPSKELLKEIAATPDASPRTITYP